MSTAQDHVVKLPEITGPDEPGGLVATEWYGLEMGSPPGQESPRAFFTDTSICIGCKACEVACKQWNQLPADDVRWSGDSYDNTFELSDTSWRHVKFVEDFSADASDQEPGRWLIMSDQCKHCEDSPCHDACPSGAIVYTEYGGVFIQYDICVGCSSCVAACPFGVITRSDSDGHAHKCTMCLDRLRDGLPPACSQACPTGSIAFGCQTEMLEQARERLSAVRERGHDGARLYGDEPSATYTALRNMYLLLDEPRVYGLPDQPVSPRLVHLRGDYLRAGAVAAAAVAVVVILLLTGGF